MHSYIHIVALRLGTLAVQRGDVEHAVLEPNHKTVFGGHLQKMEGPAEAIEDPAQWSEGLKALLVLTLLSVTLRQAPVHDLLF